MTREEYNASLQDMQRFCQDAGLMTRFLTHRDDSGRIYESVFQVYYYSHTPANGTKEWRTVATQRKPFTPETSYSYIDHEDMEIRAEVARDLCK